MSCDDLEDVSKEHMQQASSQAGVIFGYVSASSNVLSILSTSWLAAASDAIGRRIVLIGSAACLLISCTGTVLVFQLQWSTWLLIPFSLAGGIGGTFTSFNAAIFALAADVLPETCRPARFMILESSIFLGGMVGTLVGGVLQQRVSDAAPFMFSAALYCIVVLYVAVVLPETVSLPASGRWRRLLGISWLRTTGSLLKLLHPCPTPRARDAIGASMGRSARTHTMPIDLAATASGEGVTAEGIAPTTTQRGGTVLPWLVVFLVVFSCDGEAANLLPLLTKLDKTSALEMSSLEYGPPDRHEIDTPPRLAPRLCHWASATM
jgi:MFS family permease